ncbi:MAG: hypothetical protein LBL07_18830 [Tannerella sp.]|jgi:hypothetical protein|nr:hypothetical protein [Tannerella sp.]
MIVTTVRGEKFELTKDEELYYKALKRLEKYKDKQGRLILFGASGTLSMAWKEITAG